MDKVFITQLLIEKMKERLFMERFSLFDCLLGIINRGFLMKWCSFYFKNTLIFILRKI